MRMSLRNRWVPTNDEKVCTLIVCNNSELSARSCVYKMTVKPQFADQHLAELNACERASYKLYQLAPRTS